MNRTFANGVNAYSLLSCSVTAFSHEPLSAQVMLNFYEPGTNASSTAILASNIQPILQASLASSNPLAINLNQLKIDGMNNYLIYVRHNNTELICFSCKKPM